MPAARAACAHDTGESAGGENVAALDSYSATVTGVVALNGRTGTPPTIGHDSSSPCSLQWPQWTNIPNLAVRNQSVPACSLSSTVIAGTVSLGPMLAAFSITPLGVGDSVSASVADAVRLVRESGLPNETNAMFTNVEGDWDEVMALIGACVDAVSAVAPRVSVVIKIDHRPGTTDGLTHKVAAVEAHLAE